MTPKRNKQGTVIGEFDETRFDINQPVEGTTVQGLVQMGRSNGLNVAVWFPVYAMSGELP